MSVNGFDNSGSTPTLKTNLDVPLIIGGMTEGVLYKINKVKIHEYAPLVNEVISLRYDFQPSSGGYYGYENLFLFVYRPDKLDGKYNGNYVKYFDSILDLETFIKDIELEVELDKQYAINKIEKLKNEISKLELEYGLNG